jgi:hypothetical protein
MTDEERAPEAPETEAESMTPDPPDADPGATGDVDEVVADEVIADVEAGPDVAAMEEAELDEGLDELAPPIAAPSRGQAQRTAGPSASEIAVHIDDRISAIFVLAVIAVFIGILLYGLLAGSGGVLTPPSPSPSPIPSAAPSASPSPSAAPSASPSPSAAPSPSA